MRAPREMVLGLLLGCLPLPAMAQPARPGPIAPPGESLLLHLPGMGTDPDDIDYARLPTLKATHAVISPPDPAWKFQLHNYMIHHEGRYWCMWSHGPGEDEPTQHVRYATSADGLVWGESRMLAGPPEPGYAYIARGFWVRDGELLALVAHFKGKGAFGVDKELQLRALAWDARAGTWSSRGLVYEDAINNFPPQELRTGEWMMTRRDSRFNASMLSGGVTAIDDWRCHPITGRRGAGNFSPDEPFWWALPDHRLMALFRDNGGSGRLFRAESGDDGRTWSAPVRTNFPNATSKFFALATSGGYRVMISNANPRVGRRQLFLSTSEDGRVFTRLALLSIPSTKPATLQYPHAIERDGHLFITFSRNKATIEVLRLPLSDLDLLRGR